MKIGEVSTEKDAIKALLKLCLATGAILRSKGEKDGEKFQGLAYGIATQFITKDEAEAIVESLDNDWKKTSKASQLLN